MTAFQMISAKKLNELFRLHVRIAPGNRETMSHLQYSDFNSIQWDIQIPMILQDPEKSSVLRKTI